jgi:hypothetical protein
MSTRRLEEILEECLRAYLERGRSIEESLSLYPSYADELDPLLRTAVGITYTLGTQTPPAYVQQRGLHRFLNEARVRRSLRDLGVEERPGWFATLWQRSRMGFAGAAVAVAVVAGALGASALMSSDGGEQAVGNVSPSAAPETPAAVLDLQRAITDIRTRHESGFQIETSDIQRLRDAAEALRNASPEDIASVKDTVEEQLAEADSLVSDIGIAQPAAGPTVDETRETIRGVAADLGVQLPTGTPTVTTVPSPSPEVTPTATPTVTSPADTPTPAPTDGPTPEPTPVPSDPPPREPAAIP